MKTSLVKRSSRFQGFTPEGERVLIWARRMVGDAHAMQQELQGLQSGSGAHIRIVASPSATALVSALTLPFQQRYPNARVIVLTRTADVAVSMLHHRDADAGIVYIDEDPIEDAICVPLFREQYLLLTTADNHVGTAATVRWSDIASLPLCLFTRDTQHRRIVDSVLASLNVQATPLVETDSPTALMAHVETGRWASIVTRSMLENVPLPAKLQAIPIVDPEITRTVGLVVSERFPIQPTIVSLIEQARALTPESLAPASMT